MHVKSATYIIVFRNHNIRRYTNHLFVYKQQVYNIIYYKRLDMPTDYLCSSVEDIRDENKYRSALVWYLLLLL